MKKLILFLSFFLLSGKLLYSQVSSGNSIKNYPGIPLVSYLYFLGDSGPYFSPVYNKIDTLGFHSVIINNLNAAQYNLYELGEFDFKIIPDQNIEEIVGEGHNLINRYTEAKFSVWQAEETPEEDGLATLVMNKTYTVKAEGDTVIRTIADFIPKNTELINGPQYWQEASYFSVKPPPPVPNVIEYTADFVLKIEELIPSIANPADTICLLQVTASWIDVSPITGEWDTLGYHVVDSLVVLFGDFTTTNQWQNFLLNYDLTNLPDSFYNNLGGKMINPPSPPSWDPNQRNTVQNVEYKIIWQGNAQNVRLYVDKVTLSDERGLLLQESSTKDQIRLMLEADYITQDYENKISGWIGLDEPGSIDNFEPIRIIHELLENHSGGARLWISLGGSWNGRYGDAKNPSKGQQLQKVKEFFKRVKNANVLQNFYPFDYPCTDTTSDSYCQGDDYRVINIKTMADSFYAQFNQFPGAYWGASIQVGQVPDLYYRDNRRHEFLYQTNLALLYGAKVISPWIIFGSPNQQDGRSALIDFISSNNFNFTDKYYTLKDTLYPRLSGLMGKTIKNLKNTNHFLGIDARVDPENYSPYEYVDFIKATGGLNDVCFVELGFFDETQFPDKKYFMPLNRYYSTLHNMRIGLRALTGYINWDVTEYTDSTSFTVIPNNNKAEFIVDIYPGDAKLYSVAPVVKYGGTLIADEIAGDGMILNEDMIIDNGAVLSVYQNYTAKGNIIVEDGSIINLGNGKINFQNGKKLIVRGNAIIEGTTEDKLTFDFISPQEDNGIVVEEDAVLLISNCIVKNAETGILAELNAYNLDARHINFVDCENSSVVFSDNQEMINPLPRLLFK